MPKYFENLFENFSLFTVWHIKEKYELTRSMCLCVFPTCIFSNSLNYLYKAHYGCYVIRSHPKFMEHNAAEARPYAESPKEPPVSVRHWNGALTARTAECTAKVLL